MILLMWPALIGGLRLNAEVKYPIPPGGDITKVGNVELTFDLIANSLQDLEILYRENMRQEGASACMTKFMKVLGISGGLVDGLIKSLRISGKLIISCNLQML
jgi:hypothetical protein